MVMLFDDLTYKYVNYVSPAPFGEKQALVLSWKSGEKTFMSDICPLPGYSKETLKDVIEQLEAIKKGQYSYDLLYPSVHFALMHPLEQETKITPQRYQALVHSHFYESKKNDLNLFKTLKIKIKDFKPSVLIELIKKYSKSHIIRLDAQRGSVDPLLIEFLLKHPSDYEYIEEPCLDQKECFHLKIALDETLYTEKKFPQGYNPVALVYKPTLCGGLDRIKEFNRHIPIVISSCYETSLGLKRLVALHQKLYGTCSWDIGLDTFPLSEPTSYLKKTMPYVIDT